MRSCWSRRADREPGPAPAVGHGSSGGGLVTRATALVLGAVLVGLALVQGAVLSFLPTPWAVPDVVTVTVLAVACGYGPVAGGLVGAWAGLVLDLSPPAAGPLGGWILVLACVGAALGRVVATRRPGPWGTMLLLALAAGVVVPARAAVLWFAGAGLSLDVPATTLAAVGYGLLLAPLALLAVVRDPARRSTPIRTVPTEVGP